MVPFLTSDSAVMERQKISRPNRSSTTFILLVTVALSLANLVSPTVGAENSSMKDDRPECQMWSKLENKTLPLQNQGHANCTTNDECTGFTCNGIYQVGLLVSTREIYLCISNESHLFSTFIDFSVQIT